MEAINSWASRHKFWTFIIILFIIGTLLTWAGIVDGFGLDRVLGNIVAIYLVIWVIMKLTRKKEKEHGKEKG